MSWRTVCAFAACSRQLPVRSSLDAQRQRRRAAQHEAAVPLSWLRAVVLGAPISGFAARLELDRCDVRTGHDVVATHVSQ